MSRYPAHCLYERPLSGIVLWMVSFIWFSLPVATMPIASKRVRKRDASDLPGQG